MVAAGTAAVFGKPLPLIIFPSIGGVLLIVGVLFERVIYKKVVSAAPSHGWVPTGERFVDPATGERLYRPASGFMSIPAPRRRTSGRKASA